MFKPFLISLIYMYQIGQCELGCPVIWWFCLSSVDGVWSGWSSWSSCSLTCGNGTSSRNRTCTFRSGYPKGNNCTGDDEETQRCNTDLCPGMLSLLPTLFRGLKRTHCKTVISFSNEQSRWTETSQRPSQSIRICCFQPLNEPPRDKTNKMTVGPAKTQISLGIRPVWSESSLCASWVAKTQAFFCG